MDLHRNIFLCAHVDSWRVARSKLSLLWAMGNGPLLLSLQVVAPPAWNKQDGVLLAWSTGGRGKLSSESKGGCGLPPLGSWEQAPPVAQVTSEFSTKECTATKHYPFLLSLVQECTCPTAANAKCSWNCLHLPEGHSHSQGPENRHWLLALPLTSISLEACAAH